MISAIQRRLSYANVAATLALVFSMGGGALAAKHYMLNSTKEINPKVLKKLRGHNGKNGAIGSAGPQGKEGSPGKEGPLGKEGKQGPTGNEGPPAASGAVAWAFMSEETELQDVHNFSTTYTKPGTGVYCLTPTGGVSPSTDPIELLTVEDEDSSGQELFAFAAGGSSSPCEPSQYAVRTYEPAGAASENVAFYIVIPG